MSPEHEKIGNDFSERTLAARRDPFDKDRLQHVFHYGSEAQSDTDKEALMAYSRMRSRQTLLDKQIELLASTDKREAQQALLQRIERSLSYIDLQKKLIERELAYAEVQQTKAAEAEVEDPARAAAREAMHREAAAVEQQRIINPNPSSWTPFREPQIVDMHDASVLPKNIAEHLEEPQPDYSEERASFFRAERKRMAALRGVQPTPVSTGTLEPLTLTPEMRVPAAPEPLVLTPEMRVEASAKQEEEPLVLTSEQRVAPAPAVNEIGDFVVPDPAIFEPWRQVAEEEEAARQAAPVAEPMAPDYDALTDYASYRQGAVKDSVEKAPTGAPKLPGVTVLDAIAPPTMAGYAEAVRKRSEAARAKIEAVAEPRRKGVLATLFLREPQPAAVAERTTDWREGRHLAARRLGLAALIGLAAFVNYKKDEQLQTLGDALTAAKLQHQALAGSYESELNFLKLLRNNVDLTSMTLSDLRAHGFEDHMVRGAAPQPLPAQPAQVFENVFSAQTPEGTTSLAPETAPESSAGVETLASSYELQQGDTLWDLAEGDVSGRNALPAIADLSREDMQPIIKKFETYLAGSVNLQAGLGLPNPHEGNRFTDIPVGTHINLELMNDTLGKIRSGEINVSL